MDLLAPGRRPVELLHEALVQHPEGLVAKEWDDDGRAGSTGGAVDESIETGGEPIKVVFEEDEGDLKRVEISGEISVADFFSMSGNFALETNSRNFTLKDSTLLEDAELFTIGGSEGTAFAGINGPADNESALGPVPGLISQVPGSIAEDR